jgi:hypothetical protein
MSEETWSKENVKALIWIVTGVYLLFAILFLVILMMFRGSLGFVLMVLILIFTAFFLMVSLGIVFL